MEAEDAKRKICYSVRFAAYAKYMNILLGNEKESLKENIYKEGAGATAPAIHYEKECV